MSLATEITISQLQRGIGLPNTPVIIDVRLEEDYVCSPRFLPGSIRRDHQKISEWLDGFQGREVIILCQAGKKLSQGVASLMRHSGIHAQTLEGGFEAWQQADGLLLDPQHVPERSWKESTLWVTRTRPKIDRIACPWLIRRFVDTSAAFLFVGASEVEAVAARFGATPFDIEGVFWSHEGDQCTFDKMIKSFGLSCPTLERLADIVRAADTAQLDSCAQAAGLLAISLGLSRMFKDDLAQLEAGLMVYDALYRWCRDAHTQTHNWPKTMKLGA